MTRTNLITDFLGSGETTSILHLLANKGPAEKQAVLANELDEVGIDGALLTDSGTLLKEVPGGYMCCVNGLSMQVGLNTLLRQRKPDRLLIEPTDLGHPKQILGLLIAPVYEPWINLCTTLCILGPRLLLDEKSVANDNFRDQLATADIIATNKTDHVMTESENTLQNWWQRNDGNRQLVHADHGQIDGRLLDLPRLSLAGLPASAEHARSHANKKGLAALSLPAQQRWCRSLDNDQGRQACGWIFDADIVFDTIGLLEQSRLVPIGRVKEVMRTKEGLVRINRQGDDWCIEAQNVAPPDSRIELITDTETNWNALQSALLRLRLDASAQGCLRFQ